MNNPCINSKEGCKNLVLQKGSVFCNQCIEGRKNSKNREHDIDILILKIKTLENNTNLLNDEKKELKDENIKLNERLVVLTNEKKELKETKEKEGNILEYDSLLELENKKLSEFINSINQENERLNSEKIKFDLDYNQLKIDYENLKLELNNL